MDPKQALDPSTNEPVEQVIVKRDEEKVENKDRRAKAAEFCNHVLDRWKVMSDAERPQRERSMRAEEFNSGTHWDAELKKEREDKERVVLEVNRTPQYVNQVANAQRMTRPKILVKPNGSGADEKTADIKQGIIRSIERRSDAETIRDDAFIGMLIKGLSYYRLNVQFESESSWKRVIRAGRFYSDFSVYCDPAATEPLKTDAMDWIITDDIPTAEFEKQYGTLDTASLSEMASTYDWIREWVGDGTVRIAEYFYKDRKLMKLYAMADDPDGEGMWEDEIPKDDKGNPLGVLKIHDEPIYRMDFKTTIMWAKISPIDILEGNAEKTGGREYIKPRKGKRLKYIPIVPVLGQRRIVEKRVVYDGMIQDAMAPCLASDYWLSAITEMVALGPKSPWVVVYDAIAEYREMWDQANIENYAALYYDKTDPEGNELPAPFRNFGEPPIQAMVFILNYAEEDLKRVMGIYQRSLGATGPEHSGVAIQSVQREADVANYNYPDNLKRSIELEAKIELNLIQIVYAEEQVVEIIRPTNKTERIVINKMFKDSDDKEAIYDMQAGDYDGEVEIGWGAATKREAAVQGIMDFLKIDSEAAPLVGYLLARNMDFPDKEELEKILRARAAKLGAPVEDGDSANDEDKIPPQFMAQYQAQSKQLESLTQIIQELQEKINTKQFEHRNALELKAMELASQERQTMMRGEIDLAKGEMAAKTQASIEMLKTTLAKVQSDWEAFQQNGPVEMMYDDEQGLQPMRPGAGAPQQQQQPVGAGAPQQ